jgi:hypothetical protein
MNHYAHESTIPNRLISRLVPEIREFIEACERIMQSASDTHFFDCRGLFESLVGSDIISNQLNILLRKSVTEGGENELLISGNSILLYSSENISLSLTRVQKQPGYLYLHPSHIMGSVVGRGMLRVRRYIVTPEADIDSFSPEHRLAPLDQFDVQQGAVFTRDGRKQAIDFEPINGSVMILRLLSRRLGNLEWSFERESLRAWNAMLVDPTSSLLCSVMDVVGSLRTESSIEPLRRLTAHPHHVVRWRAVQTLASLSSREALPFIESMINDPHSQIRVAAHKTLSRYNTKRVI